MMHKYLVSKIKGKNQHLIPFKTVIPTLYFSLVVLLLNLVCGDGRWRRTVDGGLVCACRSVAGVCLPANASPQPPPRTQRNRLHSLPNAVNSESLPTVYLFLCLSLFCLPVFVHTAFKLLVSCFVFVKKLWFIVLHYIQNINSITLYILA